MKENMEYAGHNQGDMSPKVSDYQKPMSEYSQADANMTDKYIERQDRQQSEYSRQVRKQAYKGRYS